MANLKKQILYLSQFVTGQLLLQVLNMLNGFFLLRWLSITEQAKFGVAFSIQSLILSLSDLGFTGSIVALVGGRIDDKRLLGAYILSAKRLRNYLFVVSCAITFVYLPFVIKRQGWGYVDIIIIMTPILLAVFWQADCSLYDSTLVIHKRMKELYKPQVSLAFAKLVINFLLYLGSIISAFTSLALNALILLINGKIFKKNASVYVDVSSNIRFEKEYREMVNYLKPLFPSLVFNALYGQIQILLISFFGNTTNIAEIAALGKLSQMFLFLSSLNGMVIAPFIAKSPFQRLTRNMLTVLVLSFAIAVAIYFVANVLPGFFMYLLGPKFYNLKSLLNIMILNSCLSYFTGTIWTMSSARKWLFWWGTAAYIGAILVFQTLGIIYFGVSTTLGVLRVSLLTGVGTLLVHISISIVGILKERMKTRDLVTNEA